MRFKGLDLNLLVVFDTLLAERNVSKAGEKLHLSQSATSGALARLRQYFDDELLISKGRTMVPTPLGAELAPRVRNALLQIEGTIVSRPGFDPSTVKRDIRIVASDYVMVTWLAPAISAISREAPGIRFRIEPPTIDPVGRLDSGSVDLLLMPEKYLSDDHPSVECFEDEYCIIACASNSEIGDQLTMEQFYELPHVDAVFPTTVPGYADWFARQSGRERNIEVTAGGFTALPFFVLNSRRIALVHNRLAKLFEGQLPIKVYPAPFAIPKLIESLQWHRFAQDDECHSWVREKILGHNSIDKTDNMDR